MANRFAKPPFNRLITHFLDTNMTVSRQNLMYPEFTFLRARVDSMDLSKLVEKVLFLHELEYSLLQRLNQIDGFSECFVNSLALKYVIGLTDPPSALVVFQEIIYLLDHILNVLLKPTDAREFILIGWKPLCLILKVPNYSDNVI